MTLLVKDSIGLLFIIRPRTVIHCLYSNSKCVFVLIWNVLVKFFITELHFEFFKDPNMSVLMSSIISPNVMTSYQSEPNDSLLGFEALWEFD